MDKIIQTLYNQNKLSKSKINYFIMKNYSNLLLKDYNNLLDNNQFDLCIKECPYAALKYTSERLSNEQLQYCVQNDHLAGLDIDSERLSNDHYKFSEYIFENY